MATGQAEAQKLYFGGKLKIGGNVMASQKLEFLTKIDRSAAETAYAKRGGTGGGAPAPADKPAATSPPPAPSGGAKQARSPAAFAALKERLARAPADIDGVIQFDIKNPDKRFFVDARSVSEGAAKEGAATATVRVDEDDLIALVKGQATAQDLFMRGKLRVDGDVGAAHKLGFLQNLL
jgi:(3R)-3-hydroxyacyl-CoA dehydrogenase / 3a,7a,12a-trihydroxy-5b-cholest-24-enoyl-CoA hydratase / enoyl-CoA hydratase 2